MQRLKHFYKYWWSKSTLPHLYNEWTIWIRALSHAKAGFQYLPLSLPYPPTSHPIVATTAVGWRFTSEKLSEKIYDCLCQRLNVCVTVYLFCVRFHSQSSRAPSTRSLSKLHGSCILLQFCFLVSFVCLFVCLFVSLFGQQPITRCKCGRPLEFCSSIHSESAAAKIDGWKPLQQPSTGIVHQCRKSPLPA